MKPFFTEYTGEVCAALFGGEKVSPLLPYRYKAKGRMDDMPLSTGTLSVSGAQPKLGVLVKNGQLCIAEHGEQSTHILKPCAGSRFSLNYDMPANEVFCMQIVAGLFNISTASATLCFFNDGVPAYLTKRFDLLPNGEKLHVEDLASLSETDVQGDSFRKYQGSYEKLASVIVAASGAPLLDLRNFFRLVLANYVLCNGDAHAKNFSMMVGAHGECRLAPAYDVMNTRLHVSDTMFAMGKGLFEHDGVCSSTGMRAYFSEWAQRIGLNAKYAVREIDKCLALRDNLLALLKESYMSVKAQNVFRYHVKQRFDSLK